MSGPEANLCNFCRQFIHSSKILLTRPDGSVLESIWEDHPHHPDVTALHASAWAGCHLCSYFSIEDWRFRLPNLPAECTNSRTPVAGQTSSGLKLSIGAQPAYSLFQLRLANAAFNSLSLVDYTLESYTRDREEAAKTNDLLHLAPSSRQTGSDDCFALVAHWLKTCLTEHEGCNTQSLFPQPQRPARLIDVSANGTEVICVVDTVFDSSPEERPKYFTLSHCWGRKKMFQLTTSNRKELETGIQVSRLPQTFQDAISATRKLGYRFLWIDCLCIQQDSKEDWLRESVKMANIYGSSDLTLAAISARDSSGGLFTSRNPLCNVPLVLDNGLQVTGYKTWEEEYDSPTAPLNNRAWVFQELVASPRTLSYGSSGIYWQCIQSDASERTIAGISSNGSSQFRAKGKMQTLLSPIADAYGTWHFLFFWNEFLEFYTERALTYHSDKLAAISGLTSLLETKHSLTLYAGLWKEYLLDQLLWQAYSPQPGPKTSTFPSWSWASIESRIEARHHQIMFPDLHHDANDPTWLAEIMATSPGKEISGALHITLRAPMRKAIFSKGCTYKLMTSKGWSDEKPADARYQLAHADTPNLWVSEFFPDASIAEDSEIWCVRVVAFEEDSSVRSWAKSPRGIGAPALPRRRIFEGLVVARRASTAGSTAGRAAAGDGDGDSDGDGDFVRVGKFLYDTRPAELDQSKIMFSKGSKWDAGLWHSDEEMKLINRGWETREIRLW